MKEKDKDNELYHINFKSFINVIIILLAFIVVAGILVYVIPQGEIDSSGVYHEIVGERYSIWKIIFSPFYMLINTSDLLRFLGLSMFIVFISGAFQIMKDSNGMNVLIKGLVNRFEKKKMLLVLIITLFFMSFGSFFGVFEETIILIPLIVGLSLSLGWDTLTGLGMSLLAVGLGFGAAITNPFSVGVVSDILHISALDGIWYRIVIFVVTYIILNLFLYLHIKKIEKNKESSISYYVDKDKDETYAIDELKNTKFDNEKRIGIIYSVFFIGVLVVLVLSYVVKALDGLSIPILSAYFLIFGTICGLLITKNKKDVFKSMLVGFKSALPALAMILLASTASFLITDAKIAPTITNFCVNLINNTGSYLGILIIFLFVIILEFFISSSTAKAVLVMGILGSITSYVGITNNSLLLAYIMGDGFTNIVFPTSPVLLISLAMVGLKLKDWYKWVKWLITILMCLNILYLLFGVLIGY